MALTKDFATIVKEMEDLFRLRLPQANRGAGSIIKEAFINIPGAQFAFINSAVAQSDAAKKPATSSGNDLDALASNFGVIRNTGTSSTGTIYLILPDSFPSGQDVIINDGQIVSTKGQNSIDFRIVGQLTLSVASASLLEAEANRRKSQLASLGIVGVTYLASAPIAAVNTGSDGNVGIGAIGVVTIPGVKGVVNLDPTVGGTDSESDASLRERISLAQVSLAVGTSDSYKATVLNSPSITSAFVVSGGDPLMTRDGTVIRNGQIVDTGSGRCVDIWTKGKSLLSSNENFIYTDKSDNQDGPVAAANQKILGYTNVTDQNPFALQPVNTITSVIGNESGANFVQAVEVEDNEGNILLEGNYYMLPDILASQYMIVREVSTGRLRVARQLSEFSTKYFLIRNLVSSDLSNSAKGADKLIFTSDRISINDEIITRGPTFGGADALLNTDVLNLSDVKEEVNLIKETVSIGIDHHHLVLKHRPIVTVQEVKHVRLGTIFSITSIDAAAGILEISGKFLPQTGDLFQVTYTWKKFYIGNLEYFLVGDSVSWEQDIVEANKRTDSILIATRDLDTTNSLDKQPLTPTYLKTKIESIPERAKVTLTVKGDTATIVEGEDSKVLETNEQNIVLRKGVTSGSIELESDPKDPASISIYFSSDTFRRNIVDAKGNNTYDSKTRMFVFTINTTLFDNFFSVTDSELSFIVSYEVDKPFTFEVSKSVDEGRIGKILRARNLTKNIEYNLLDYSLRTNLNDRKALVDETLTDNQFRLSELANQTTIDAGDRIKFKRLPTSLHWTSKGDFENNVGDNITPTIDTSKVQIEESGNVRLKTTTEQAVLQSTVQVAGTIETDIAWSGSIEVLDDVIINPGVTLLIRAGTIIRVREQARTGKRIQIIVRGRLTIDPSATAENPVIFTSAASSKAPGDWEGLFFAEQSRSLDTSLISNLAFVEIRYATNAIHVDGSNPRIRYCRLSKNLQRGVLYTGEPNEVVDLVLRDANGNIVSWKVNSGDTNQIRIPLYDSNGSPLKLMTSIQEVPFGVTIPGYNAGLDDGLGLDGIPGTPDDGYGLDNIPGTPDDGYGPDGLPASASTSDKQVIHFTSSPFTEQSDVMNPVGYTPKYKIKIDGVELNVWDYTDTLNPMSRWTADKENAWLEYVGAEEIFYLVLYKNTTSSNFSSTSTITFSYLAPIDCGLLYQNIIEDNTTTGVSVNANVSLTIAGNTIYNNGLSSIDGKDCYLVIRNNFLQEYEAIPFSFNFKTIVKASQNNAWSSSIESETLNTPTDRIILATDIDTKQTVIEFIANSNVIYRSGQIIQIGNEKIRIKGITISTGVLVVTRGVQNTIPVSHKRGTTALLYGDRALFMVTGIPGTRCEIITTDVQGRVLEDRKPLQMTRVADNTFILSVSLDRSENYYYRYRYLSPSNNIVPLLSKMLVLPSKGTGIGDAAVDVFNPIHESFYFKQTNYSIDPQFIDAPNGNYNIDSSSPSHKDNVLYAPEVFLFNKYQGRERIQEVKNFTSSDIPVGGITSIVLLNSIVIESSVRLDVQIFTPTGVGAIYASSFDDKTKTLTFDNSTPITNPGTYLIQYYKPTNLGSAFPGYNYLGELSYVVDAMQTVDFTNILFTRSDTGGGVINFQFRSPDPGIENPQETDLALAAFGPIYDTSPIELTEFRTTEGGPIQSRFLEIRIQIRSNWKGLDQNDALFPILEDMTLLLTPASDEQIYTVKSTKYKSTTDRTEATIVLEGTNNTGITEGTFTNVGSDERINVMVYNNDKGIFESVAVAARVALNATTIELIGNLTTVFDAPISADVYSIDYLWITQETQEQVVFVEDAEQTTENRFIFVSSVVASIVKDRQVLLPEGEQLTISSTSEPENGVNYTADYEYVAPKDNEVIEVSYSYNDAIRTAAQNVESNKDLVADVLVRQVLEVPIRIEALLEVLPGEVYADISNLVQVAIGEYFNSFSIGQTTKIDQSDIIAIMQNVSGVDYVELTVFNIAPLSGVVKNISIARNQIPVLFSGSPIFSRPTDTANIMV